MFDTFNDDIRRVAMLIDYEQSTDQIPPMLVTMAKLYNSYAPFNLPERGPEPTVASGEFIAR